jgi:hypothetical protein
MQSITSSKELKNAIRLLEAENSIKQEALKEQFYITYESLKPVNLLRRTIHDISSSPDLIDTFLGSSMGLASGYISKKILVGSSNSSFRKILGTLVQLGISNVVSRNSESIKSFIQKVLKHFLDRREADA